MDAFKRILVATDLSELSAKAVKLAFEGLAHEPGTVVHMVHVIQGNIPNPLYAHYHEHDPEDRKRASEEAHTMMRNLVPKTRKGVSIEYSTPEGDPVVSVLQLADDFKADVIVMGTRGRDGLQGLIMGSIAESLVRAAHCPVLVVK